MSGNSFLNLLQNIPPGNDRQQAKPYVKEQYSHIRVQKCTEKVIVKCKVYGHENREKYHAGFSVQQNQNPTDDHQKIHTKSVVEKITRNIDLLMKRIFCVIGIDAEEKHQDDQSEKKVVVFVAFEAFVCWFHRIKI